MDKRVIFAVAGSGKTSYIIDRLSEDRRSLIITYTKNNHNNLYNKIIKKFDGEFPNSITLMTYFEFLYRFCYKPYLSDIVKAQGISFNISQAKYIKQTDLSYYISPDGYLYSNRLALFIEYKECVELVKRRLERYFDEFIIDEIQDIAGRDFNFLEKLMDANIDMLFVGDFFQHTYDTSRDGNVNKDLFENQDKYEKYFSDHGFISDKTTLINSWRCSPKICRFVTEHLGIEIHSNLTNEENQKPDVIFVQDIQEINNIFADDSIIKLHYQKSAQYGPTHKNWGETKGEDHYQDVCIMLNDTTAKAYKANRLKSLPQSTKNKLYVALTRAHRNVYLINEKIDKHEQLSFL